MDKKLFTPGPLTTSLSIKEAMLHDLGSRDFEFIQTVKFIRNELLNIAGVSKEDGYETVIMQGSGTFSIESVISSVIPDNAHLLILINGAYGERLARIAKTHKIKVSVIKTDENAFPSSEDLDETLSAENTITHVAAIHCETTTGIMNPVEDYADLCHKHNKIFFVDAMSSFGAVELNLKEKHIDILVSSSNKCIEGVPGFSFVIIRKEVLQNAENKARTLSLDLFAQWKGLETDGQFRFTPPTHALLAFKQALIELGEEGGVSGRARRYSQNHKFLTDGMQRLGFREYIEKKYQGYIITSFLYPDHPNFDFVKFYSLLNEKGQVIYPGKLSHSDCFRIGNIGRINTEDIKNLLYHISNVLLEMDIRLFPR